jgi:hypothetical protein
MSKKAPVYNFWLDKVRTYSLDSLKKKFSRLPKFLSLGQTVSDISTNQNFENPFMQVLHEKPAMHLHSLALKDLEGNLSRNIAQIKLPIQEIGQTMPPVEFKKAELQAILETQQELLVAFLQAEQANIKATAEQKTQRRTTLREQNIENQKKLREQRLQDPRLVTLYKTIKGFFSRVYKKIFTK